jgi:hypothetical protein
VAATRREHLADCEPAVDDEDVCKSALLEPPLADSEQPAGPLRHRGHGLDGIEAERVEPDEALGETRRAAGEHAVGASGDAAFELDLDLTEPVGAVGKSCRSDSVGDQAAAARGGREGEAQQLVGDVDAVRDQLDRDARGRERGSPASSR